MAQHRVGRDAIKDECGNLSITVWQTAQSSRGISKFLPNQERGNRGTGQGVLCLWVPKTLHAQHRDLWWALKPGEGGCLASSHGES